MIDIHCYNCGGFISDPSQVSYRLSSSLMHTTFGAPPTSALCTCTPPVIYGPAGRASSATQAHRN